MSPAFANAGEGVTWQEEGFQLWSFDASKISPTGLRIRDLDHEWVATATRSCPRNWFMPR